MAWLQFRLGFSFIENPLAGYRRADASSNFLATEHQTGRTRIDPAASASGSSSA